MKKFVLYLYKLQSKCDRRIADWNFGNETHYALASWLNVSIATFPEPLLSCCGDSDVTQNLMKAIQQSSLRVCYGTPVMDEIGQLSKRDQGCSLSANRSLQLN